MRDAAVSVPASITIPIVKFESNVDFQKHDSTQDGDAAFMKCSNKPWMQPKGNQRINHEVIATLLASQGGNQDSIEKLLSEEISYRDLGSLTDTDLELMGFKNRQQREELVEFLQMLPNQDPSYESILKLPEAKTYNRKIVNSATAHLETMRSALSAANYKLKIMPAEDVVVGEKSFASRFVQEALSELEGLTDEIDAQLQVLDKHVKEGKIKTPHKKQSKPTDSRFPLRITILMSTIGTATLAAIWFWRYSK